MLHSNQLIGFGAGEESVVTLVHTENVEDITNLTTFTFSSADLSIAGADRKIVVGISANGTTGSARSVSSMTINGVSASLVVAHQNTTESQYVSEMWAADVPTGATGDIVITWNAAMLRCGIGVYAIYGAGSSAYDTGSSSANPMTDTLNIPAKGVAIGEASEANWATFGWTNLTEDFDVIIESSASHTGASAAFATLQSALSITCTQSVDSRPSLVIASWGPA